MHLSEMWTFLSPGGGVKDVIKFPLLCLKPYRLGLRAANTETYKMAGTELKNFNFILLCIINSGMSLTFEHGRFMAFYMFLSEEYERISY